MYESSDKITETIIKLKEVNNYERWASKVQGCMEKNGSWHIISGLKQSPKQPRFKEGMMIIIINKL